MELSALALSVGVGLSAHVGVDKDYNGIHPYVAYAITEDVAATLYYNSNRDISLAVGYTFHLGSGFSIDAGAVTGYEPLPVYPYAKLNYDVDETTRLSLAPLVDEKVGVILSITFSH